VLSRRGGATGGESDVYSVWSCGAVFRGRIVFGAKLHSKIFEVAERMFGLARSIRSRAGPPEQWSHRWFPAVLSIELFAAENGSRAQAAGTTASSS